MSDTKPTFVPDPIVARGRYHVHPRTLARWDKTLGLGFPPPIYIRGRRYREAAALDQWDLENSRRAAALHTPARRERETNSTAA